MLLLMLALLIVVPLEFDTYAVEHGSQRTDPKSTLSGGRRKCRGEDLCVCVSVSFMLGACCSSWRACMVGRVHAYVCICLHVCDRSLQKSIFVQKSLGTPAAGICNWFVVYLKYVFRGWWRKFHECHAHKKENNQWNLFILFYFFKLAWLHQLWTQPKTNCTVKPQRTLSILNFFEIRIMFSHRKLWKEIPLCPGNKLGVCTSPQRHPNENKRLRKWMDVCAGEFWSNIFTFLTTIKMTTVMIEK